MLMSSWRLETVGTCRLGLTAANKESYYGAANACILYGPVIRAVSETLDILVSIFCRLARLTMSRVGKPLLIVPLDP